MNIRFFLEILVRDRAGRLWRAFDGPANSLVAGWMQLLYIQMTQAAQNVRHEDNGVVSRGASSTNLAIASAVGLANEGVVVGTGSAAVTVNDYNLGTKILHGTGAGQLQYNSNVFTPPVYVNPSGTFTLARQFSNGSGAAVTVREVGILTKPDSAGGARTLIDRTLTGDVVIPNAGSATATYTATITV